LPSEGLSHFENSRVIVTVSIKKMIQVVLGNFGNIRIEYFIGISKNTISYEYLMNVTFNGGRSISSN